jgi:SAM-dependent methyltransferase
MSSIEQQYYENPAFWDGSLFTDDDHRRLSFVAEHVPRVARSLCDVGCGNGLFLDFLCRSRPDLLLQGVDRSSAALKHVRVPAQQASISELPFAAQCFDAVSCLEVIEHLPLAAYQLALDELARICGRTLIISVPLAQDLTLGRVECPSCRTQFNPDYHFRSFEAASMPELFAGHGFRMTDCKRYGDVQEFAFSELISRLKRDRGNRFSVDILCPACGQTLPGRGRPPAQVSGGQDRSAAALSIKSLAKRLWPKVVMPRWMLAVYERT